MKKKMEATRKMVKNLPKIAQTYKQEMVVKIMNEMLDMIEDMQKPAPKKKAPPKKPASGAGAKATENA